MGKHSGRNALSTRLKQLGFDLSSGEVDDVFRRFKALADKKKVGALLGGCGQPSGLWGCPGLGASLLTCFQNGRALAAFP
jgi:hypothetical protein